MIEEGKQTVRLELSLEAARSVMEALESAEYWDHHSVLPVNNGLVFLPWDEGGARYWEGRTPSGEELQAINQVHGLREIANRFKEALAECEREMEQAAGSAVADVECAAQEMAGGVRVLALVRGSEGPGQKGVRRDEASEAGERFSGEPLVHAAEEELAVDAEEGASEILAWTRTHNRSQVIKRIRDGLNARSDRTWSVTGGQGTAYGWLKIDAPPKRRTWDLKVTSERTPDGLPVYEDIDRGQPGHHMSPDDRRELGRLLGYSNLQHEVHHQGVSIPAGRDYYAEFIDRAEGRKPSVSGTRYWD